jgi:hypothetical protein
MSNYTAKGMESVGLIVSGATSDLEAKKKQAYEMFKN